MAMRMVRSGALSRAGRRFKNTKGIDFSDPTVAYKSKSNWELTRALIVFKLCAQPWLVQGSDWLLQTSTKIVGETVTHAVVRKSFFAHFCAGEDEKEIQPTLKKLEEAGVGAILDYAAESAIEEEGGIAEEEGESSMDRGFAKRGGVQHEYVDEADCDANMEMVLSCIRAASQARTDGIAAVKLTGLCKPKLLQRVSKILLGVRRIWLAAFTQVPIESIKEEELRFAICKNEKHRVNFTDFKASLLRANVQLTEAEMKKLFDNFDQGKDGFIDYLEWSGRLSLKEMSEAAPEGEMPQLVHKLVVQLAGQYGVDLLEPEETELTQNMVRRLSTIAQVAHEKKVRVLVDAEQTYIQTAVDYFTTAVQRLYNKDFATVFNTYQCYLNFSKHRLMNDLERSRRENWRFAGKLVRGAYMVQERKLAQEKHYLSPILANINETHDSYNECVRLVLEQIHRAEVVVATHNQESIEAAVDIMKELNIDPKTNGVYFSQLLGMADNLSLTLGQAGYKVFKYVPYGPVGLVMPYLMRRAQENGGELAGAQKECDLLWAELKRRKFIGKA